MRKYLKTQVIESLANRGMRFLMFPDGRRAVRAEVKKYQDQFRSPRKRGVYYFVPARGIDALRCAMDSQREGASCRKRIVVRPSRFRKGLHELYTYHFPKHWSAACVANREMIKEAQRQAHALEKDFSLEAMEWRIRFFNHYFRVFKGGERPEEGFKAYSRFYQYTYVAIYRELKAAAQKAKEIFQNSEVSLLHPLSSASLRSPVPSGDITFEPIDFRPILRRFASPLRRAYNYFQDRDLQPPDIQEIINQENIPRTTEEFAYMREKQ